MANDNRKFDNEELEKANEDLFGPEPPAEPKNRRGVTMENRIPGPFRQSERDLIEGGMFIKEIDDAVKINDIKVRLDNLADIVTSNVKRLERVDNKQEELRREKEQDDTELVQMINELKVEMRGMQVTIDMLKDIKENRWFDRALKLFDNQNVRGAVYLLLGWIASRVGPELLKGLMEIMK